MPALIPTWIAKRTSIAENLGAIVFALRRWGSRLDSLGFRRRVRFGGKFLFRFRDRFGFFGPASQSPNFKFGTILFQDSFVVVLLLNSGKWRSNLPELRVSGEYMGCTCLLASFPATRTRIFLPPGCSSRLFVSSEA
jgi:hypothetical protein